jgi:anti-sigma28 factor (negative regulator of flagellin synthesis)
MVKHKTVGSDLIESIINSDPEFSQAIANQEKNNSTEKRQRSSTLLKLQWLSERMRKAERIYRQVREGTYHADSKEVAKSMLNLD